MFIWEPSLRLTRNGTRTVYVFRSVTLKVFFFSVSGLGYTVPQCDQLCVWSWSGFEPDPGKDLRRKRGSKWQNKDLEFSRLEWGLDEKSWSPGLGLSRMASSGCFQGTGGRRWPHVFRIIFSKFMQQHSWNLTVIFELVELPKRFSCLHFYKLYCILFRILCVYLRVT